MFVGVLAHADDWKGESKPEDFSAGLLTGLGIIDGTSGYALIGTFSRKIIPHGFIPDIANSVSIEGVVGPVFIPGLTAWLYGAHLRWDFVKDINWTFYGLGGLGGNITSPATGSRFELTPRFGVGTFFQITEVIRGRAEVTHDGVTLGVNFLF